MKANIKLLIFIVCMMAGMLSLKAQTPPASVNVTNGAGTDVLLQDVFPTVDLVTKGTTVPYFVFPDPVLNPLWTVGADAKNTTNLVSTFQWTITNGIGSTSATIQYMELPINGNIGTTGTISVEEISPSACPGSATTMNAKVVAPPSITAESLTTASICQSGTNGSLNVALPQYTATVSVDAAITTPAVKVKATMTFTPLNGTATTLFTNQTLGIDASGNISTTDLATALGATVLNSWGTYALEITAASDVISRKDVSAALGYFTLSTPTTATFSLFKTPSTGPIYHLPN